MCAPDSTSIESISISSKRRHHAAARTNNEGNENATKVTTTTSQMARFSFSRRRHSLSEASSHLSAGTLLSVVFVVFATYFPFILAPMAAKATYQHASFNYNAEWSHFDNTFWTWGTDYFLALAMGILIWSFPSTKRPKQEASSSTTCEPSFSHVHTIRSQGMLWCYLLSVLAGGLAHQFYTTLESRAHWSFRLLWTICVGTVTAAPGFMGSVATELSHIDRETRGFGSNNSSSVKQRSGSLWTYDRNGMIILPSIPTWFWTGFAICSTLIVAFGGMSFQRPACDIFVAGITQSPSTFYVMAMFGVGLVQYPISNVTRFMGAISFILNAPLLPLYPLLVQYTDWSLGTVNLFLHTWLLFSWSMQGLSLRQVAIALQEHEWKDAPRESKHK
ncbi:hypothetical protein ACA910_008597 [Epithemia clementina (nom. ined.)]